MEKRLKRMSAAVCAALFALAGVFAADAPTADAPAAIGRVLKAMPWLAGSEAEVPFDIVRLDAIPILAHVPVRTEYYEIDPDVVASGYSYFFYVRGLARDYLVGSTFNLIKLCRELEVVEELKKRNKGAEAASGAGAALAGVGRGLANLVVHPGVSMRNFGESFRSFGRSVERSTGGGAKVGEDERGLDRSHLGGGPAGGIRRAMAYELGVDVYTDNPDLRRILTGLSRMREAGGLVSWVLPYGISFLSQFNPLFGDEKTEALIRDLNPYDLRRHVGRDLETLFGMDREDASVPLGRLLLNPNYTPREIAYISKDLRDMGGVAGLDRVLDVLSRAETPEMADLMALELRLYAFYHARIGEFVSFVPFRHFFASIGRDGVFRFFFAADSVRPWSHANRAFDEMILQAMSERTQGLEVWTTADVDSGIIESAARRGVVIRDNILLDRRYFPAPEQGARR